VFGNIARLRRLFGVCLVVAGVPDDGGCTFGHAKSSDCCVPPSAFGLAYDSPAYRSRSQENCIYTTAVLYKMPTISVDKAELFKALGKTYATIETSVYRKIS
jgi:hypothetical protein